MRLVSLSATAIIVTIFLANPVHAFGSKCRQYVSIPTTVAISNGKAVALLNSRFYNYNRLRGHFGPHQNARILHPTRKCSTRRSRYRTLK